jgi:hypothetical protein
MMKVHRSFTFKSDTMAFVYPCLAGSYVRQYHNPIVAIDFDLIIRTRVEYYFIIISLLYNVVEILFTIYYLFMSNMFVDT